MLFSNAQFAQQVIEHIKEIENAEIEHDYPNIGISIVSISEFINNRISDLNEEIRKGPKFYPNENIEELQKARDIFWKVGDHVIENRIATAREILENAYSNITEQEEDEPKQQDMEQEKPIVNGAKENTSDNEMPRNHEQKRQPISVWFDLENNGFAIIDEDTRNEIIKYINKNMGVQSKEKTAVKVEKLLNEKADIHTYSEQEDPMNIIKGIEEKFGMPKESILVLGANKRQSEEFKENGIRTGKGKETTYIGKIREAIARQREENVQEDVR